MVVMVLENVPVSVRGELTRWMLEPRAGTFVGSVSALVRENLWAMVCGKLRYGSAIIIHTAQNEQGFIIRSLGTRWRTPEDFDGLTLIRQLPEIEPDQEVPEKSKEVPF
ncbi:type I-E CRISPR-associated endoribonuclease Cas2e [bacterium]|nr:type I-E CRISPR-associated endoribonuclease Cas2e [bacterium]